MKPYLSLSSSITNKHIRANEYAFSPTFNQETHKEHISIYQFNVKTMASEK